jgi:hypothetical protein
MSASCCHPERSEGSHNSSWITQLTLRAQRAYVRSLTVFAARDDTRGAERSR